MGFYNDVILPRLCHLMMRNRHLVPYRERVIASVEGRVRKRAQIPGPSAEKIKFPSMTFCHCAHVISAKSHAFSNFLKGLVGRRGITQCERGSIRFRTAREVSRLAN